MKNEEKKTEQKIRLPMNYDEMSQFQNLMKAHVKSRRGKRDQNEVIQFEIDLGAQLLKLQSELLCRVYVPRPYQQFRIYDPKPRLIYALRYRDRIVQHTLCDNVIEPFMERHLIYDNAASRKGKGTHFAIRRLEPFLRKHYKKHGTKGYLLKFDIKKYFENIDHEILFHLFENAFHDDPDICQLIRIYIDSYGKEEGRGLPLGNQTSTWFALYYLDGLDRLIKERLRIKYYTRYMDDGVIVHEDREYLRACLQEMEQYIKEERKLAFNEKTQIVPLSQGVDYLGFRFYLTDSGKVIKKLRSSGKDE